MIDFHENLLLWLRFLFLFYVTFLIRILLRFS